MTSDDALRQLVAEGTLNAEQAHRVAEVLSATAEPAAQPAAEPAAATRMSTTAVAEPRSSVASVLVEVAAYLGGALLLGGGALLLSHVWDRLSRSERFLLMSAISLVLLGVAAALGLYARTSPARPAIRRLAATVGALGALGAGLAASVVAPHGRHELVLPGITIVVVAVALHAWLLSAPTLFVAWLGGHLIIGDLFFELFDDDLRTPWGLTLAAYGLVVMALAFAPTVAAGATAPLLGGATALFGAGMLVGEKDTSWLGLGVGAVVVVASVATYLVTRWASCLIGAVLVTLFIPAQFLTVVFDNYVAGAVGLIGTGLVLLGVGAVFVGGKRHLA